MRTVPRADHISHLEGAPPSVWQAKPCNRVGKFSEGGRELACRGLTFIDLYYAAHVLYTWRNTAEVSQLLFLLLVGRAPPFKEMIDWL